ncbi:MAG TPA: hypothetical protein VGD33_02625 [Chitinophagaceae bacterium]
MKRIMTLYKTNPAVTLIVNGIAFLVWAITLIFTITIVAVALTV